jgi:NADH-quinone oxidoreductase subunit G
VLPPQPGADLTIWDAIGATGTVDRATPLASSVTDFYLTNPIARASATMAECSRLFVHGETQMAAE